MESLLVLKVYGQEEVCVDYALRASSSMHVKDHNLDEVIWVEESQTMGYYE